jgi:hypothetical protein
MTLGARVYLALTLYAPRWAVRLAPKRWRHRQLRALLTAMHREFHV